jgi:hypothetical protein
MAKRFIDTGLFDDQWFSELSQDAKVMFMYYITKCNHAGLFKYNERLIKFQTGIEDPQRVIKELGKRLVTLKEELYFMPKYIEFQYPGFPKSKVKQQEGALRLLEEVGIGVDKLKTYLTVSKELSNSYDNDSVSDIVNVNSISTEKIFEEIVSTKQEYFYDISRITKAIYSSAEDLDTIGTIRHFLILKDNTEELNKPLPQIISHLKNWINKQSKDKISDYGKKYKEYARSIGEVS